MHNFFLILILSLTVRKFFAVCVAWMVTIITPNTLIPVGVYYSKGEGEEKKQGCTCGGSECQC